jgi:hypothetical protein
MAALLQVLGLKVALCRRYERAMQESHGIGSRLMKCNLFLLVPHLCHDLAFCTSSSNDQ